LNDRVTARPLGWLMEDLATFDNVDEISPKTPRTVQPRKI
jgi:hypothetical protein